MDITKMTGEELKAYYTGLKKEYDSYAAQNLSLDMSRGKPGADQLEISMDILNVLNSSSDCISESGIDCRNYGIVDGIPEAKRLFSEIFDVDYDEILVGGNSSLNMMFDTISSAMGNGLLGGEPWANQGKVKFLCPSPGYDRHFAICEYFGIEMITVSVSETGPDMDEIERLVSSDALIKGIWCVPKYSNPTGITYSDETVRRFAALKPLARDFRIFWDNSYFIHTLYEDEKLLNLLEESKKHGNENLVYMYFSTSKITFPGSGLAGMATSKENVTAIKKRMSIQTIGPDKINQLRHMKFIKNFEVLKEHMNKHAEILRPRFDAVLNILESELALSGAASWTKPKGGYFISVDVLEGCAKEVVRLCKEAGVTLTGAGATFPYGNDPRDSNIRIAPTYPPVSELRTAMKLFSVCVKLAAAQKLINK